MVTITPEMVMALLGIIGILVGGWREQRKNKSIAEMQNQLAAADREKKQAEAQLIAIRADAEQQSTLAQIAKRQQDLLERLEARQNRINREFMKRWATVSALFNDVRAGESNIHNAVNAISVTLGQLLTAQQLLPAQIQQVNNEVIKETATLVGAEIGAAIARELAMNKAERKLYPFPDAEDKRWRDDWIYPLVPDVILHKEAYFDDDMQLKKSCSQIAPEGEKVRLIEVPDIEAIAVYKVQDGVPCYGWLPKRKVRIGQPAPTPPDSPPPPAPISS